MDQELRHRLRAQKTRGVRLALVTALRGQGDVDECLDTFVSLDATLTAKLQHVDLTSLLESNCQTLKDLEVLLRGLQALRDVGRRLCTSGGVTGDRVITKATSSLATVLDHIQGGKDILRRLGYTEVTDTEVRIPSGHSVSMETIAGITADLMVASDEIERYMSDSHPQPDNVTSVFPAGRRTSMLRAEDAVYENTNFQHKPNKAPSPKQNTTRSGHNQTQQDVNPKPIPAPRPREKPVSSKKPDMMRLSKSTEGSTSTQLNSSTGGATRPQSSLQGATGVGTDCDLCGNSKATTICPSCEGQRSFCEGCDRCWHAHLKRRHHERQAITTTSITRPKNVKAKTNRTTQEAASHRSSVIVVPGKRSTQVYQLEKKVSDSAEINGVYSLSASIDQRPHPPLAKKPNIVPSVTGRGVPVDTGSTAPNQPNIRPSQSDNSPDSEMDDAYENFDFHEQSQSSSRSDRTSSSTSRLENIPTVVQEFSIELENEGDLHRRKVKVDNKLTEVEHRLGSIASGMERISVTDRISLMKEQDFLKGYKSDLDNKIVEKSSQQTRITARGSKPKVPFPELANRLQHALKGTSVDEAVKSSGSGGEYTYSTVIKPLPIVQAGATFPRWERNSIGRNQPKSGTKETTTVQNDIYGSQLPEARKSSAYEDIEEPTVTPELHTLPKRSPGQAKEIIRRTMSEPIGPNETWPCQWECSHCTMHNAKGTRVCSMCSKTSDAPMLLVAPDDRQLSSLNRPLPSLPPDALPAGLVGKSPDTCLLLKRLVILQKRYSYHLDPEKSDDDLLNNLSQMFHDNSLGILYPSTHQEAVPVSPEDKIKKTRIRDQEYEARQLLYQLKDADQGGFTYEEFELALTLNNNTSPSQPVDWLRSEWMSRVNKVVTVATKVLSTIHPAAKLSKKEARLALVNSQGIVKAAAIGGVDAWKEAYEELLTNLAYGGTRTSSQRTEVVTALLESEGDLSVASMSLFKNNHSRRLIENIWNCENSVYGNDEVPLTLPGRVSQDRRYDLVSDKSVDIERRALILMAEFGLETKDKAENVIRIWDRPQQLPDTATIADVIEAVRNCGNTTRAMSYLSQTCAACEEKFPAGKIHMLSFCQCKLCSGCLKKYFSMTIKEKHVRDLVCPMCQKPNIENREQFEQHIQLLTLMLKHHLSLDDNELFEKKLRDWHLMQDPNFRWCSYDDCSCGFVFARHHQGELMMQCPECQRPTCFRCKKPWEAQHYNLTCEQFDDWKINNDPSNQLLGLAQLLQNNGIDCPNPRCRCRYAISKGGCMHFTCSQCGHEFCSGCYKLFYRGSVCPSKLPLCGKSGLHCHHPRNCLYYLRNEPVEKLQQLLQRHNVGYDTAPPGSGVQSQARCLVQELKDNNKDEACGRDICPNHAGLCEAHYKEYLVSLINKQSIDPLSLMNMDEVKIQFTRAGRSVPSMESGENLTAYKQRLLTLVQQQFPLPRYQKRPTVVHSSHTASMVT